MQRDHGAARSESYRVAEIADRAQQLLIVTGQSDHETRASDAQNHENQNQRAQSADAAIEEDEEQDGRHSIEFEPEVEQLANRQTGVLGQKNSSENATDQKINHQADELAAPRKPDHEVNRDKDRPGIGPRQIHETEREEVHFTRSQKSRGHRRREATAGNDMDKSDEPL